MLFEKFVCPNGRPPSECGHIPQLIKNTQGFFSRLVARSQKDAQIEAKQQVQEQHPAVASELVSERQTASGKPERTRIRTRQ
ncbi:MAG: hypothetical protein QE279_08380 [Rhodoferax sp.]|nr:hypothetical protein [Rhodoferax sp.]